MVRNQDDNQSPTDKTSGNVADLQRRTETGQAGDVQVGPDGTDPAVESKAGGPGDEEEHGNDPGQDEQDDEANNSEPNTDESPGAGPATGEETPGGTEGSEQDREHSVPAAFVSQQARQQPDRYEGQDMLEQMLRWLGHDSVPPGLLSILQSLIFASDKPLTVPNLKKLLDNPDTKVLRSALRALQDIHRQMGVQLVEVAGGFQFRTNPEHARWVKRLVPDKPVRLSRAALEVLAVIAYRQPVTRAEIEDVRGVDCGGVLRSLLERSLIKIMGRKPEPGRPLLYGTSKEFLSFFGLKGLKDLPSLRDLDALEEEQGTASQDRSGQTLDSVLADDLAELIAEQDSPGINDDTPLEKALEEAREAAKKANKTFKALKQKERSLQADDEQSAESETRTLNQSVDEPALQVKDTPRQPDQGEAQPSKPKDES